MLILSEANVRQCLDMQECIDVNRQALIAIATGDATVPTRLGLPYLQPTTTNDNDGKSDDAAEDWTLFKPASLQKQTRTIDDTGKRTTDASKETVSMGMKVVSIRANNVHTGHPLVPATVLHIDPVTGIVDALVAATYMTAVRTAAGSAIAIHHYFHQVQMRHHMNHDASISSTKSEIQPLRPQHVVVFGAGLQAEQHIRAIACIFQYSIPHITIINRNTQRSELLKDRIMSDQLALSISTETLSVENSKRIEEVIVLSADVIITCTNTVTPLWGSSTLSDKVKKREEIHQWSNRSCIIAGIGSYTPFMQEIPNHVVDACQQIWIDTSEATKVGDLKHTSFPSDSISVRATPQLLGSVLLQQQQQRQEMQNVEQHGNDCNGLVFYKAVGTAIQDILTADIVVDKARKLGIGTSVDMQ